MSGTSAGEQVIVWIWLLREKLFSHNTDGLGRRRIAAEAHLQRAGPLQVNSVVN
jgi:hypothetical protein